jgi:serine/threonine protein kinase
METIRIGKYQTLGTLGTGAHSSILHINRSADAKPYALKVVQIGGPDDLKFLEQAENEFEIAQKFNHPNLIKVYALEVQRDWLRRPRTVHLLIEYVKGQTLDSFKRIPIPQLVQIFVEVAAGLVHMHRHGVFHTDLKPNNILLSRAGQVKIIDYGLARTQGSTRGRVQGTPEYMAPEQAKHGFVNERTDIYNFGASLYRLAAGRLAPATIVEGGGLPITAQVWDERFKPVQDCNPDAPQKLCDLIHRCLAFNPAHRFERASEVQGALDHMADELVRGPEDHLEALEW